MTNSKPIVKWVGGKRQLLPELHKRLPEKITHYVEPFFGGGALYFSIWDRVETACLSDVNEELINVYLQVKKDPEAVIEQLSLLGPSRKEQYDNLRNMDRAPNYKNTNDVIRAARFIYLNKCGFNGLYRVNKNGFNNVPYGKNPKATICDQEAIVAAYKALQKAEVYYCGYWGSLDDGTPKDTFVYLDPPYVPLTPTSSFTGYTQYGFGQRDHEALKVFCDYLNRDGIKWMQSNSSSPIVYDLYKGYNIEEVDARRSVNSDGAKRGTIKEVIIRNY